MFIWRDILKQKLIKLSMLLWKEIKFKILDSLQSLFFSSFFDTKSNVFNTFALTAGYHLCIC